MAVAGPNERTIGSRTKFFVYVAAARTGVDDFCLAITLIKLTDTIKSDLQSTPTFHSQRTLSATNIQKNGSIQS